MLVLRSLNYSVSASSVIFGEDLAVGFLSCYSCAFLLGETDDLSMVSFLSSATVSISWSSSLSSA